VVTAVELLESMDIHQISLADTVGVATPQQIAEVFAAVNDRYDYLEIGCHLHSRREEATAKVLAAYDAGCRRFDSAISGLGGCPFAQDTLVGNIPTEAMLEAFTERGVAVPIRKPLDSLIKMSADMAAKFSKAATD
jgi:hydroxymethylglutaryl-CoA lyase